MDQCSVYSLYLNIYIIPPYELILFYHKKKRENIKYGSNMSVKILSHPGHLEENVKAKSI